MVLLIQKKKKLFCMNAENNDSSLLHEIFLNDVSLLDVRAPIEFSQGAFPCAINEPLLDNSERKQVGICYSKHGQKAAIKLGHGLVHGKTKDERLNRWASFAREHPKSHLYCFRGGLRSETVQGWPKEAGIDCPRIPGGYKAMRHYLMKTIDRICEKHSFIVLGGRTGSGKTKLLNTLPSAIDLEALANHRGSAFGSAHTPQPRTINFEHALAIKLLKIVHKAPNNPLVVEDESRLLGAVSLPLILFNKISSSPLVILDLPMSKRIENVLKEYVVERLEAFNNRFDLLSENLLGSLFKIRKKLGGTRTAEIKTEMEAAIKEHQEKNLLDRHRVWIKRLLQEYYDPFYDYSLNKHKDRILTTQQHPLSSESLLPFLASSKNET